MDCGNKCASDCSCDSCIPGGVEVVYPSAFEHRVMAGEAPGGQGERVALVAPTIAKVGEPLVLKVAVADAMGYPSVQFEGDVTIRCPQAESGEIVVPMRRGVPAVAVVRGVTLGAEGLLRFEAMAMGKTFHANPTSCQAEPDRRIYWGDPHVHTVLSDCHADRCRSENFCYISGRWFAGLDWLAAADHVSNGRCELARWKAEAAASNAYNDPPTFATLPAYEASFKGGAGGDNNVYMSRWPGLFVDDYDEGTVKTMCDKLAGTLKPGEEFFAVPHHTTRTGKHGEIGEDIYPGPQVMPVMEIHSKWGTSEYRGNPSPLKEIHPGPSYAVDLLGQGLQLGFIGGTDTHSTMAAGIGDDANQLDRLPGMTAVMTGGLSRQNVFEAIAARNCYAACGERIYLDVEIAGLAMGQSVAWPDSSRKREVRVTAAAPGEITSIDIIRNGKTIHSQPVGDWQGTCQWRDESELSDAMLDSKHLGRFAYYYVRVNCASGARAWSSPVWLTA